MDILSSWNLIEWLVRLLFIEMGVLAGILVKGNIELPTIYVENANPHPKKFLKPGSIAQFVVGFASSFAFQIAGIDLLMCWVYATSLGTVVNIGHRLFTGRLKESEVRRALKTAVQKLIELEELQGRETQKIEMHLSEALREAKMEKIGEVKESLEIVTQYPFKNGHDRIEEAMDEGEKHYKAAFEHSPIPCIHFDKKSNIIAANKSFLKILGHTRESLLGLNIMKLKDKKMVKAVKFVLKKGKIAVYKGKYETQFSDGRIVPLECHISPIFDKKKKVVGGMMTVEQKGKILFKNKKKTKSSMTVAQAEEIVRRQMIRIEDKKTKMES